MASRCAEANILGGHPRSDLRLRRFVVFNNDKAGVICEQTVKVSRIRGAFCLSFSRAKAERILADPSFDSHHVFSGQGHRTSLLAIPRQVADIDKSTIPISTRSQTSSYLWSMTPLLWGMRFLFPRFFKWL
jgi:hypothetical protein